MDRVSVIDHWTTRTPIWKSSVNWYIYLAFLITRWTAWFKHWCGRLGHLMHTFSVSTLWPCCAWSSQTSIWTSTGIIKDNPAIYHRLGPYHNMKPDSLLPSPCMTNCNQSTKTESIPLKAFSSIRAFPLKFICWNMVVAMQVSRITQYLYRCKDCAHNFTAGTIHNGKYIASRHELLVPYHFIYVWRP